MSGLTEQLYCRWRVVINGATIELSENPKSILDLSDLFEDRYQIIMFMCYKIMHRFRIYPVKQYVLSLYDQNWFKFCIDKNQFLETNKESYYSNKFYWLHCKSDLLNDASDLISNIFYKFGIDNRRRK